MSLTKKQKDKIIEKVDEALKKKNKKDIICSVCGNEKFTLAGGVSNIFITDKVSGGIVIGGPVLPNAPIVCLNCGNTLFLNLKVLGVEFEEDEQKEEEKDNEKEDEQK